MKSVHCTKTKRKENEKKEFSYGDLVIGDIKLFGWWYGKLINHKKPSAKNLAWVYWFGDHKILEYPCDYLRPYKDFHLVFTNSKLKKPLYRKAVQEFLNEVFLLHKKKGLYIPNINSVPKHKRLSEYLDWALNEFLPVSDNESGTPLNAQKVEDHKNKDIQGTNIAESLNNIDKYNVRSCKKQLSEIQHTECRVVRVESVDVKNVESFYKNREKEKLKENIEKEVPSKELVEGQRNLSVHEKKTNSNAEDIDFVYCYSNIKNNNQNLNQSTTKECSSTQLAGSKEKSLTLPYTFENLDDCYEDTLNNIDVASSISTIYYDENYEVWRLPLHCYTEDKTVNKQSPEITSFDENGTTMQPAKNSRCQKEHNHRQVHTNSKPRKVKLPRHGMYDGIKLDETLIGKSPQKRRCSFKVENAIKKLKGKNEKRRPAPTPLMDLPVESMQEKVLSWKYKPPVINKKEIIDATTPQDDVVDIHINDLVIGKLKGFDWWFGKVLGHKQARQHRSIQGMCWVYWYGDHKLSEMPISCLELLDKFSVRFLPKKMRGSYMSAVEEVLNEAAFRSGKEDLPDHFDEENRLKALIKWAFAGFKPYGVKGFRSLEDKSVHLDFEESSTSSICTLESGVHPRLSTDVKILFDKVAEGLECIENLCLACGDTKVFTQHPIFEGGLCKECKVTFMESHYLYDTDGSQMYCTVCSDGDHIIVCDNVSCSRSYCPVCIDMLCGVGYTEQITSQEEWLCFMCVGVNVRLLRIRCDWQERVNQFFHQDNQPTIYASQVQYDPVPYEQRRPIRVLSLFDGIATACLVLKKLNMQIGAYIASEIDHDANMVSQAHHGQSIKHVGDVQMITKEIVEKMGPFDLLIGGSPCSDLSIANPQRKGVYDGTGRLFFEFYRILQYVTPQPISARPFFWLFENVVSMKLCDKEVISRFLQCHPVVVSAKDVSAQHRTRYFWGNLPGMKRPICTLETDNLLLQDCLEPNCGRVAKFDKVQCITTVRHSLRQTKKSLLPVQVTNGFDDQTEDELWLTEIERIFGFPEHYTDICNMGQKQRQKLLGKAWSVPVIEHLLMPLKDFFKLNDSNEEKQLENL